MPSFNSGDPRYRGLSPSRVIEILQNTVRSRRLAYEHQLNIVNNLDTDLPNRIAEERQRLTILNNRRRETEEQLQAALSSRQNEVLRSGRAGSGANLNPTELERALHFERSRLRVTTPNREAPIDWLMTDGDTAPSSETVNPFFQWSTNSITPTNLAPEVFMPVTPPSEPAIDTFEYNQRLVANYTAGFPEYNLGAAVITDSDIRRATSVPSEVANILDRSRQVATARCRYMAQLGQLRHDLPEHLTTDAVLGYLEELDNLKNTARRTKEDLSIYIRSLRDRNSASVNTEPTAVERDDALDFLLNPTSSPTSSRSRSNNPAEDSIDTIIRDLRLRYTSCYGYIEDGKTLDLSKIFFVLNFDTSRDGGNVTIHYVLADGSSPKYATWDKDKFIFTLPKLGYINANYISVLFRRKHKKSDSNKFKRGFRYDLYPATYSNLEEARKSEIILPSIDHLLNGSGVLGYKMYLSLLSEDSYVPYDEAINGIMLGKRLSTALNNKFVLELVSYNNIIILKRLQFIIGVYDQVSKKIITSNELFNKELDNLNIPYEYVRGSI